jgi:hypothetical protein
MYLYIISLCHPVSSRPLLAAGRDEHPFFESRHCNTKLLSPFRAVWTEGGVWQELVPVL